MGKMQKTPDGFTFADFVDNQGQTTIDNSILPRRLSVIQYFKANYWDECIFDTYQKTRARDLALWDAMVASGQGTGLKKPEPISANNEAVAKMWASATDEFKKKVEEERDAARKVLEEAAQRNPLANRRVLTPEDYQTCVALISMYKYDAHSFVVFRNIDNAASVLQPVLNGIFEKLGWVSTLILAGPMPDQDGEISVRW